MSVHYKFKSALEYDTITFDGLHISVKDLKNAIVQQKRIGKNTDFDLQVTNAQTKEVYDDEEALIAKNTSLLIARIPVIPSNKSKNWEGYGNDSSQINRNEEGGTISKAVDLSSLDASEDDKIRAMISQSTQDYDPSNYMKIRGANQVGVVPLNYRCYKCHQQGHWIKDCPLSQGPDPVEIKKSTGIPRSFMVPVEGPQVQGAMMTPNGSYAVPVLDHQTYTQKQQPPPPSIQEEQPEIPEDLICSICSGLLTDAVMIPCCGNSFCDECIRSSLLESEDHECPDCHERDISPVTLIPNRYLRNSVANFKNTTGYIKKPSYKAQVQKVPAKIEAEVEKEVEVIIETKPEKEEKEVDNEEKTVISEADSTEQSKINTKIEENKELESGDVKKEPPPLKATLEGPPGVSPIREKSPKRLQPKRNGHSSNHSEVNEGRNRKSRENSPRRPYETTLSRMEERPGTPTVDEPGNTVVANPPGNTSNTNYSNPSGPYPTAPPSHGVLPPLMGMPPPHLQGPPPNFQQNQPPPGLYSTQGPPPNYRMPMAAGNPPGPYMGPYNAPTRPPMFDHTRPPIQGPPPNYAGYPPRSRGRDFGSTRIRTRTPPGIIDDPLEAFNRMLREKDERERRAKQRKGRSYSRSTSRSYSRSPKRGRSRSPRRRGSRSRSRSFSMSRSRSRSFSPSPRNAASSYREYSPRHASPRCRRPPSRYRSPVRSPQRYRYKEGPIIDRNRDRDYDRHPARERDRGYSRDRDYGGGYHHYERERGRWPPTSGRMIQDNYYPAPEVHSMQQHPPAAASNRYSSRESYPPYKPETHHVPPPIIPPTHHAPPPRRYEDIAPPGTDQPPIPGEEIPPRYDDRYQFNPEVSKERFIPNEKEKEKEKDNVRDSLMREKEDNKRRGEEDKRKFEGYNRSPPQRKISPEQRSKKDRHESPDKHKRRRHESTEREKVEHKKDERHHHSDDERSKKNKEKKKKREKKDEKDKKKRREKKDKHERKRDEKDQKKEKKENDVLNEIVREKEKDVEKNRVVSEDTNIKRLDELKEDIRKKSEIEQPKENLEQKDNQIDLYEDFLQEGVDTKLIENYIKTEKDPQGSKTPEMKHQEEEVKENIEFPPENETCKDEDVLDIHANELELKSELDKEVLAPLPEKSRWELEDDGSPTMDTKLDGKQERSGKVTNEVLKRAENAIFAKAINAIRPIEIKKISVDRAKLYSDQKKPEELRTISTTNFNFEEEISDPNKIESEIQKPPRLSVKERLGVKVDDIDRIVKVSFDRNRSRSLSPLSKRTRDDPIQMGRNIEIESRNRYEKSSKDISDQRYGRNFNPRSNADHERRPHRSGVKIDGRKDDPKRKRSTSRSASKEHKHKKKDKKQKKDHRSRKHKKDDKEDEKKEEIPQVKTTEKRKPTLDEANFEPDYDLESESEKEEIKVTTDDLKKVINKIEEKKESSSSDSSDSSSEEERKKKKHRKHKKKRSRKDSTSSSSSSDSDSSEEEKERKRKKHKKKQKKKKKSKHK
ncbi:E3 ubiquitin-protein ligase RBBP6 isoform X1 [Onthophagus taurus]|uniref:E3 ubiquitin-protein ligase RBBP6 isoform X1 n=1 Tax=Onthophagus taurus TaxID=166361 RepID=UPI0039BE37BC